MTIFFLTITSKKRFNDHASRTRQSVAKSVIKLHYSPRPWCI